MWAPIIRAPGAGRRSVDPRNQCPFGVSGHEVGAPAIAGRVEPAEPGVSEPGDRAGDGVERCRRRVHEGHQAFGGGDATSVGIGHLPAASLVEGTVVDATVAVVPEAADEVVAVLESPAQAWRWSISASAAVAAEPVSGTGTLLTSVAGFHSKLSMWLAGGGDRQHPALAGFRGRPLEDEVRQAVGDDPVALEPDALEPVGMRADDHVGPGVGQSRLEVLLAGIRAGLPLRAPVQEHDRACRPWAGSP